MNAGTSNRWIAPPATWNAAQATSQITRRTKKNTSKIASRSRCIVKPPPRQCMRSASVDPCGYITRCLCFGDAVALLLGNLALERLLTYEKVYYCILRCFDDESGGRAERPGIFTHHGRFRSRLNPSCRRHRKA